MSVVLGESLDFRTSPVKRKAQCDRRTCQCASRWVGPTCVLVTVVPEVVRQIGQPGFVALDRRSAYIIGAQGKTQQQNADGQQASRQRRSALF